MDSLKLFIRQFPMLGHFNLNGRAMNGGLLTSNNFDSSEILEICPKLDKSSIDHFISLRDTFFDIYDQSINK